MSDEALPFFNPRTSIRTTRNRLGHWDQTTGGLYFLTCHLADSLPASVMNPWRERRDAWLRENPPPHSPETELRYHQTFTMDLERALDAGYGSCLLKDERCGQIVMDALAHFEGRRTTLHAAVVMPNHIHAVIALSTGYPLVDFVKGLKGTSARHINRLLKRTGHPLWQKDYFDRLIRDSTHYGRCIRYIANNPVKAGLPPARYLEWYSPGAATLLSPG